MSSAAPLRRAGEALTGPFIWVAHFLAVYASESLACRWSEPAAHDAIVAGATFFAIAAILLHAHRTVQNTDASEVDRFMRLTALALDGLSLIGVCWAGLAALLLGACR